VNKTFLALALTLICMTACAPAQARAIACQVDEAVENGQVLSVPVTIQGETETYPPVTFKGIGFSASWIKGDKHEPQAVFMMNYGDLNSSIYDFSPDGHAGPINVLSKNNIRFQCWVASEETP